MVVGPFATAQRRKYMCQTLSFCIYSNIILIRTEAGKDLFDFALKLDVFDVERVPAIVEIDGLN